MRKVFLDVDNTIVLWTENSDHWKANQNLVNLMIKLHLLGKIELIVWSFGGEGYARKWANQLIGRENYDKACSKDPSLVNNNIDIIIDDDANGTTDGFMKNWSQISFLPHELDRIEGEVNGDQH